MPISGPIPPSSTTLCLLGGPFVLKDDQRLEIPEGSKRLLTFVGLTGGRVSRRHAAGTLWPDGNDERASGNLRSALWRLRNANIDILHADKFALYLDPDSTIDIVQLHAWATRVMKSTATENSDLDVANLHLEAVHLLPGWYEDWVIFERERLRQRLLHAMESLVRKQIECHHFAGAIETAMFAVGIEPLRESAQRLLIEAHLAEGNLVEACRVFATYRDLISDELGVLPSRDLAEMLSSVLSRRERNGRMKISPLRFRKLSRD